MHATSVRFSPSSKDVDPEVLKSVAPPPPPKSFFARLLCLGSPELNKPELVEEQVGGVFEGGKGG